jgi:hypothetical protein
VRQPVASPSNACTLGNVRPIVNHLPFKVATTMAFTYDQDR